MTELSIEGVEDLGSSENGKTVVYVSRDKKVIGALSLSDKIRPESAAVVKALRKGIFA